MKKILVTILALSYLAVSSGIAINIHYCMGEVSSVDLIHGSEKCSKCGMKKGNGGCCKDEFKIVKLSDSHKLISTDVNISTPAVILDDNFRSFDIDHIFLAKASHSNNNSPPRSPGLSLNILHCIYRL